MGIESEIKDEKFFCFDEPKSAKLERFYLCCDAEGCDGQINRFFTDILVQDAKVKGWTERDGKWFCPEHKPAQAREKGGEG